MANVAKKYAEALYSTLKSDQELDQVQHEFTEIIKAVKETSRINDFMSTPVILKEKKKKTIAHVFNGVHSSLLNLLYLIIDKNKFNILNDVYNEFNKEYNAHYNQEFVTIESVYKLTDEEIQKIGQSFVKRTPFSKLLIENKVNEQLIGGVKIYLGTKVYDGSIKGQLNDLKHQFKARTNS